MISDDFVHHSKPFQLYTCNPMGKFVQSQMFPITQKTRNKSYKIHVSCQKLSKIWTAITKSEISKQHEHKSVNFERRT